MPRNFATLKRSRLPLPFTIPYVFKHYTKKLSNISTGQVSDLILLFTNLQSPVFLLNSRSPQSSHQFDLIKLIKPIFLLPKLQNHFAEFLQYYYLIRLNILYLFTWVGLSTVKSCPAKPPLLIYIILHLFSH